MWIMAKRNHVNIRTGQKVLTEGKQYQVIGYRKKDGYTVKNKIKNISKRSIF